MLWLQSRYSPLENHRVALGLALDDVEDADGLVRRRGREALAVVVELSIVLNAVSDELAVNGRRLNSRSCPHAGSRRPRPWILVPQTRRASALEGYMVVKDVLTIIG